MRRVGRRTTCPKCQEKNGIAKMVRRRVKREPRDYQKQTFWLRSVEGEYLTPDGSAYAAFTPAPDAKAVWVTECKDCGAHFDQALRYHAKFKPDIRCPTCAAVYRLNIAMGLPVKPFPLPKAPKPRKPPSKAVLRRREKRKAQTLAKRQAKAERMREIARRKKASLKLRRARTAERVKAYAPIKAANAKARALRYAPRRLAAKQAKRAAMRPATLARLELMRQARCGRIAERVQTAAAWLETNKPEPQPKSSTAERVAAHRAAKRTAAGTPPPRPYTKRRSGPLSESERKARQAEYTRRHRARKKAPRDAGEQGGA